jgi:hypothetical protein
MEFSVNAHETPKWRSRRYPERKTACTLWMIPHDTAEPQLVSAFIK